MVFDFINVEPYKPLKESANIVYERPKRITDGFIYSDMLSTTNKR
jgi:hypothetical protein